jgi:predicted enzyme related to lactoylglutathione lyase
MTEPVSEMAGQAKPEAGTFCWTEIATTDAQLAKEFFAAVFGWKFNTGNAGGMEYHEFSVGDGPPNGGLYEMDPKWFGDSLPPPHFMTYIAVDDVDENARRAVELGGKLHKAMDVPNVGRIAILEDPTGAMFATYKMQEGVHHG